MKQQKRILWYSDYGTNCMTGYATVSRNIIKQLKRHYGDDILIKVVAVNYFDAEYLEYNNTVHVVSAKFGPGGQHDPKFLPKPNGEPADPFFDGDDFGRSHFAWEYANNKYDVVFMLGDYSTFALVVPLMKKADDFLKTQYESIQLQIAKADKITGSKVDEKLRKAHQGPYKKPYSICYFPVDGPIHATSTNHQFEKDGKYAFLSEADKKHFSNQVHYLESLSYFDKPVTYTEYGFKQIMKQATPLVRKKLQQTLDVMPHGTNTTDFFPLPADEKKKFRDQYFGKNAGRYIIGVINRNQPRKDIPTSIFAFIESKQNWPQGLPAPFLYLHMHPSDPLGWNLPLLLKQCGLDEGTDYMFSKGDENGQVQVERLNCIYNAIDVYLSTCVGGGWELTVTEAMACKVPCIVPAHTSLQELGGNGQRAWMLDEFIPVSLITDSTYRLMCHYQQVAEVLGTVATSDTKDRVQFAHTWVCQLDWENLADRWIEIFKAGLRM